MTEEDLALVSTEDLISALLDRHEHAVFGAFESLGDEKSLYISRWKGNAATTAGLCTKVLDSIWTDHRSSAYSEKEKS